MKPFRERNLVIIGLVSLSVIAVMILGAFRADRLPLIGGGDTYFAEFTEAGGLKAGNEVRIAGVPVGKVKNLQLVGDRVRVEFLIDKGVKFGKTSGAEIRVRTLLGSMFLAVVPEGDGQLEADGTIPVKRTVSPYDVIAAFSGLSETTDRIDTKQLGTALNTLADVAGQSPDEFKGTIDGVSSLSRNVAARDQQINSLLTNLEDVSGVLADRNTELARLFKDGDVLFRAVASRRESIHKLLVSTQKLSTELSGLIKDTRADLKPALDNLNGVVKVLRKNQDNLDETLRMSGAFYRVFANTLGTGPWFDAYVAVPDAVSTGVAKDLSGDLVSNVLKGIANG